MIVIEGFRLLAELYKFLLFNTTSNQNVATRFRLLAELYKFLC